MIADGVAQGYAEAQVASGTWKARSGRIRRGWTRARVAPALQAPGDWVSDIVAFAGTTRTGVAVARRYDPALARTAERFRADIAAARAEAVAHAKGRVAHA